MESWPRKLLLKKISEYAKGYLIGLFMGDGYSYHRKVDRHYVVEFYLDSIRNKSIIKFTAYLLNILGLNCFRMKDKRYNVIRLKVNSKTLYFFIKKGIERLSKAKDLSTFTRGYRQGVVSGFFDAEGCIQKSYASVSQVNKGKLFLIRRICESLGMRGLTIRFRENYKSDKKIGIMHIPLKFIYILSNSLKIAEKSSAVSS